MAPPSSDDQLLSRLRDNEVALRDAYGLVGDAVRRGRQITPAAEWFIDNFHLIEEQIRTARLHLPRSYHRELPRLANGPEPRAPRVYHLALELISHSHGRVDGEGLRAFVAAYQEIQPLRLGELWAIPIMLRLALIENLRRVVMGVTAGRRDREAASDWVARMLDVGANPSDVVRVLAELIEADPPLTNPFVAELASRVQAQGSALAFPLAWLEQRLGESGQTLALVFELASRSQADDQVSVGNSIGSLRFLGATDWRDFVEATSHVERTLREDPTYAAMDFATRDRYRHVVESLAREGPTSEDGVARAAIAQAKLGLDRTAHVGYALIDGGRSKLESVVRARRRSREPRRALYGISIAVVAALATLAMICLSPVVPTAVLAICALDLAIGLVHWAATILVAPKILPRDDFEAGIPIAHATLVAVPALLTDADEIDALTEALEVRFLANRDPNLGFALVTDFRDAATEVTESDAALVARATAAIEALATKYTGHGGFFLFHRARRWNPRERMWMGWERKRGKLEELNAALRGELARFATVVGPVERLAAVRYVIALDADTGLPRDAARMLAGTLAHPLNRPVFDERRGRVTQGYAILQPRVGASMASISRTRYAHLFGGQAGIDPYTRAVSDVYQDVFGEGSFIGKGIYDVDAVQRAIGGRLPDDRVLSHDLLEGAYARAALVSDVMLVEDFPASHAADVARRHRWTRGDWQLLAWLFRSVPGRDARIRNPISNLSQWKILDNLRRSVTPIALVALLASGWRLGAAWFATAAVVAIVVVPTLVGGLAALFRRPRDQDRGHHARDVLAELGSSLARAAFRIACLPYDALQSLDAIGRALVRVFVTRRRLLEWRTASDAARTSRVGLLAAFGAMLPALAVTAGCGYLALADLPAASPILVAWLAAPIWSWWASRPIIGTGPTLTDADRDLLGTVALRTWQFFATYVTAEDNHLPPDNVQDDPPRGVAHRTSPTNIGLSLLASLAAHDFGYITLDELLVRTTNTLTSLRRMERHGGHFLNWYDTRTLAPLLPRYVSTVDSGNLVGHLLTLATGLDMLPGGGDLAAQCRALAEVDDELLYDHTQHLFSIGYGVADRRLDVSRYDLLASEARLGSFVAIAQGKLPQEHWFRLGRQLTTSRGQPALLSWSGSMFEYLMPLLVMPTYPGTLLDATYRASVARQIAYGRERGVPWGASESGYNKVDAQLDYQYRAFGVPGLGFKRGLAEDLVIAPYATALAAMIDPVAAAANMRRLVAATALGTYGFHEAIDYTVSRLPPGEDHAIVRSYMAHHQGMTLLAMAYVLLDRPMQRRFAATPAFRAAELLLQERVPRTHAIFPHPAEVAPTPGTSEDRHAVRVFATPSTPTPEVQLLSNGQYHVMVTNAGGGYSRWRDLAVTRWHEDATRDCWGTFGYVRDVASDATWSIAHQPTLAPASSYEAVFSQSRAEFRRLDHEIETKVEIGISSEDDVELRRVSLANRGRTPRTLELTSFAEIVLAPAAADAAHPAFSNLFVQTEIVRTHQAIVATRRPRSGGDQPPWLVHLVTVHGRTTGAVTFETSRLAFVGRGRSALDPIAMSSAALTDSEGAVLDPIVAVRNSVELAPDETAWLHVVTGMSETRAGALALAEKYRDRHAAERVFELAWTRSEVTQRRLEISTADAQLFERLAGHVVYANATLRAPASVIARNRAGQSGLWAYGISGDLPIVLVRIADLAHLDLVRQLVKAHAYWRLQGLVSDLVVWNEDPSGYRQVLHDEIVATVAAVADVALIDKPGGIFVRRSEQIAEADKLLMQTVARVIIIDTAGTLAEQVERKLLVAPLPPVVPRSSGPDVAVSIAPRADLVAYNGFGGFTPDGREYVITTSRDQRTPAPWVNVLANPYFGTVVSESGSAYTWCENAHEHRLTPWHNDAVSDPSGEAFYLRDEDDGTAWSPTPQPMPAPAAYTTRHGFGYTVFEVEADGIASELRTFVATDAPIKLSLLTLRNRSGRARRLSLTAYFELVLGAGRAANAPHIATELDAKTGALVARNSYDAEFAARVAFLDCSVEQRSVSGDRREILGRNGSTARPACLDRVRLSNRLGAAFDPCLAMQAVIELADGEPREIAVIFGSGRDLADARHLVERFRGVAAAHGALESVWAYWNKTLGAVNVQTPDASVNFLANGWLLYQVLACRMWGRSGFYQSGGAFGFRDQLQDAMALVHAEPTLLREQIVRAAARQFPQGDVQHWWHPPLGRGVRTHISDDYLWLPYATCRYVAALGDTGLLDEKVAFIDGRAVKDDEDSYYDMPARSGEAAPIYDHCVRAIRHGLRFGVHGLPLMGSGDWNDGMNLVGERGLGESVWLAFFLCDVLAQFAPLARARGDGEFADTCISARVQLRASIAAHAWDGAWYRRAYFDDGTPLGSATNRDCQIDSLPQSWAVLSGAGDPERARQGLASADARLVDRALRVVRLFDPPFDSSDVAPGYVKGYVPGVRENGGQYTHAAVWLAMAFAAHGDTERAWELFELLDPIRHGNSPAAIATYAVEPYVMAADVYTNPQHAGHGGWTWYTGAAGWMYRFITESLLGIRLDVDRLHVHPRLPASWPELAIHYRHRETVYHLRVVNRGGEVSRVSCDGIDHPDFAIPLRDDRADHHVEIELAGIRTVTVVP